MQLLTSLACAVAAAFLFAAIVAAARNDAWFAWIWHFLSHPADRALAPLKQRLLSSISGSVVELGAGIGSSVHYIDGSAVSALFLVEPNVVMHDALHAVARASTVRRVEVIDARGEALPMMSGTVDVVFCVLTLCSVDDGAAVVAEVHRVLKPGGHFMFIEHVRSALPWVALLQWAADSSRLYGLLSGGCHLHRDTATTLISAVPPGGWASIDVHHGHADVPFPLPLAWGTAKKGGVYRDAMPQTMRDGAVGRWRRRAVDVIPAT